MVADPDIFYMRLALREARKGLGRTSPNPCVGAVIVKDGEVIARGYHKKAGTPHAEINALGAAILPVAGATMYVTLEPCNHTGRTPPCSQAILASGISRVVAGMVDPNPRVDGSGLATLSAQGVEVRCGVLAEECRQLNQPFIKHITTGRPWVMLKAGVSLDGRLNYLQGKSGWITGERSLARVHRLRSHADAILVGAGTVHIDDPRLTTRLKSGRGRDPLRVILDGRLSTSPQARIYNQGSAAATWVFCRNDAPLERIDSFLQRGVRIFPVDAGEGGGVSLTQVLDRLGHEGVCSGLVGGGGRIHGSFLSQRLVDYAYLFYGPLFAGDGGVSLLSGYSVKDRDYAPRLTETRCTRLGEDILLAGRLVYPE